MSFYQNICMEPQLSWLPWKPLMIYTNCTLNSSKSNRNTFFHGNHGNNYLNNSKYLVMVQYKISNENVKLWNQFLQEFLLLW